MSQATDQDKSLAELKQEWVTLFKGEQLEDIAQAIKEQDEDKLTDDDFINDLKQLASNDKQITYVENFHKDLRKEDGEPYADKTFNLDKYKDLSKIRQAQEMADFAVYQLNIRPVDMDTVGRQTKLYQYQKREGHWELYPENRLGRLVKDMGQKEYARHLKREFKGNLKDHPEAMQKNRMGLPEHEILLEEQTILDLETGPEEYETREVERDDYALYKVNATYDPEAECPMFKEMVKTTLNGEENQIKTLQEYMGWLLKYPNRDFKRALLILGATNSGKSQIAEVIRLMFNDSAVGTLSLNQIGMERRFHIDRLGSSIINIDRDMSGSNLDSPDTIKQVISQEELFVEPKGEDGFSVEPQAKFIICSNVAPNPDNVNDEAFYGRFLTLKAPEPVPEEDRVPDMGKKVFKKESDGILNWMLEGLERLEKQWSFTIQPTPYETKMMWNEYGDSVMRFVWECINEGDEDDVIPTDDLFEEYQIWISDKFMTEVPRDHFVHKIKQQPFINKRRTMYKGSQRTCFVGCEVNTDSGNLETN